MGYRDDWIQQLKDEGEWEQLPSELRAIFERMDDEQAAALMTVADDAVLSHRAPDVGDTVEDFCKWFNSRLVEIVDSKVRLSKAGMLLSSFVNELERQGLSRGDIVGGFTQATRGPFVVLMKMRRETPYEGDLLD